MMKIKLLFFLVVLSTFLVCCKSDRETKDTTLFFSSARRYSTIHSKLIPKLFDLFSRTEIEPHLGISSRDRKRLLAACYPSISKTKIRKLIKASKDNGENSEAYIEKYLETYTINKVEAILGNNKNQRLQVLLLQVYGPEMLFKIKRLKKYFCFTSEQKKLIEKILKEYQEKNKPIRKKLGRYWLVQSDEGKEINRLLTSLAHNEYVKDKKVLEVFSISQTKIWKNLIQQQDFNITWPMDKTFTWKGF